MNSNPFQFFKSVEDVYQFLEWPLPSFALKADSNFLTYLPLRIAKKIKAQGPEGILAKEFLPANEEIDPNYVEIGLQDPIGDHTYNTAPQLIHRYSNRALFTPTNICPIHCRYCFRRNELNPKEEFFRTNLEKTFEYLMAHPEVEEIIFTGGDPLSLSNKKLEKYFSFFQKIPHIKYLRLHTRFPVILPERIDDDFISLLRDKSKHFTQLSIGIHSNHIEEFDDEVEVAIKKIHSTDCQLLSQTVLLKGINDDEKVLTELFHQFIALKIRPYYLHHPDQVKGGMHFYLPIAEGRRIYSRLRKNLPGWAIPHYVLDIPGGEGKVQIFNPESLHFQGSLLNKSSQFIQLTEPVLH